MEIKKNIILCIVTFVIASVQPSRQTRDQTNTNEMDGESEVREKLRNLFDSMAKSDTRNSEIYRDVLKQEVTREREAFNVMKEQIRSARDRNSMNKRNSYNNINMIKREDDPVNYETAIVDHLEVEIDQKGFEEEYVRLYGNDANTSGTWPQIKKFAENRTALKDICRAAYAIRWPYRLVDFGDVTVETETLTFPETNKSAIHAELLICHVMYPQSNFMVLTKGMKPDCLFQVRKIDPWGPRIFELRYNICGVEI